MVIPFIPSHKRSAYAVGVSTGAAFFRVRFGFTATGGSLSGTAAVTCSAMASAVSGRIVTASVTSVFAARGWRGRLGARLVGERLGFSGAVAAALAVFGIAASSVKPGVTDSATSNGFSASVSRP